MDLIKQIHIPFILYDLFYPYVPCVFPLPRFFDLIYLAIQYWTQLSWTLFEGECAINMLKKQETDPNYNAGDEPGRGDVSELMMSLFGSGTVYRYVYPVLVGLGLWTVLHRLRFSFGTQLYLLGVFAAYNMLYMHNVHAIFGVLYVAAFGLILVEWRKAT